MKKRILSAFPALIFMVFLILTGCQNNGHIGKIYGQWKVTHIECENTSLQEEYTGFMYWSFQNSTTCLTITDDYTIWQVYGNWRMEDGTLFMEFPDEEFAPPSYTGLTRENELQVLKFTSKEMIVCLHPTLDSSITYYLKKW